MNKKILFAVICLAIALFNFLPAQAEEDELSAAFKPEYGMYFEWVYARVEEEPERYSYVWAYGQKFGATLLVVQGEMFQPADRCIKYLGEARACDESDFRLMERSFRYFQTGEIIEMPEWVFAQ